MHSRKPGNGNARGTSTPHAHHPARILQAIRAAIGVQQRELYQVELRAAAADALEFAGNRLERVDHGTEILPSEGSEGVRHCRNQGSGWGTDPRARARQSAVRAPPAPRHCQPRPALALCACRKGHAGARKCAVREIVNYAPCLRRHAGARRVPSATERKPHRLPSRAAARCAHRVRRLPRKAGALPLHRRPRGGRARDANSGRYIRSRYSDRRWRAKTQERRGPRLDRLPHSRGGREHAPPRGSWGFGRGIDRSSDGRHRATHSRRAPCHNGR
jgi:hypothetical protein